MPASAVAWLVLALVIRAFIPRNLQANVAWHLRGWVLTIGLVLTALSWYGASLAGGA